MSEMLFLAIPIALFMWFLRNAPIAPMAAPPEDLDDEKPKNVEANCAAPEKPPDTMPSAGPPEGCELTDQELATLTPGKHPTPKGRRGARYKNHDGPWAGQFKYRLSSGVDDPESRIQVFGRRNQWSSYRVAVRLVECDQYLVVASMAKLDDAWQYCTALREFERRNQP